MARLKRLSRKQLEAQNKSGKQRIKRQPSVRKEEIKAVEAERLETRWMEWTPEEAYKELLKTMGGASPDYVDNLLKFIQESKRLYPEQSFGELKNRIAIDYSQCYLQY